MACFSNRGDTLLSTVARAADQQDLPKQLTLLKQ